VSETADAIDRTTRQAGGAVGYGVALKAVKFVLAAVAHVVIRRELGDEAFGRYAVAASVLEVAAAIASLGMGQVLLRYLPEARLGRVRDGVSRLLRVSLGLQVVGWISVAGLLLALRPVLLRFLHEEAAVAVVMLGAGLLVTRLLFDWATQVYHALLEMRVLSVATVLWQVVFLAVVWGSLARGGGVEAVIWSGAIANAAGALVLLLGIRGRVAPTGEREVTRATAGRLLRYALPFVAVNVCYNVVWRNSETWLLVHFHGERVAGWFATAYGLPQLVLEFVPTAIWPLVMASYAAVFTLDRDRARRLVSHYYKLLFFVAAPFSVGGAILGDRAFLVLYGDAFEPGAAICRIFFVVQCLSFFGTPLSMTLYILERPLLNLGVWLGAAILNLGLNYVLIPIDWRLGSVLPVSLAVALMPVVYWRLLRRLGVQITVPWPFLARAYGASSALLLLWPIRGWIDGPWTLLAAAGLSLVLVVTGMKLVRVFRAEDAPLVALIPHAAVRRKVAWLGEGVS